MRVALGAEPRRIVRLVLREGIVLAFFGLLFGLAGAVVVTRLLRTLLFGVSPTDPATFVAVLLFLLLVALDGKRRPGLAGEPDRPCRCAQGRVRQAGRTVAARQETKGRATPAARPQSPVPGHQDRQATDH